MMCTEFYVLAVVYIRFVASGDASGDSGVSRGESRVQSQIVCSFQSMLQCTSLL